ADQEPAAVDLELDGREIRLTGERGYERRQQVLHECRDHRAERGTDHDGNRQIHDVAPQQELLQSLDHHALPSWSRGRGALVRRPTPPPKGSAPPRMAVLLV